MLFSGLAASLSFHSSVNLGGQDISLAVKERRVSVYEVLRSTHIVTRESDIHRPVLLTESVAFVGSWDVLMLQPSGLDPKRLPWQRGKHLFWLHRNISVRGSESCYLHQLHLPWFVNSNLPIGMMFTKLDLVTRNEPFFIWCIKLIIIIKNTI